MPWNLIEATEYYRKQGAPGDQNALIQLLREVQRESGGSIPLYALAEIARSYGIKESLLHAIIRRIPSLRLADTHCLEICAGPNCSKRGTLADYAEKITAAKPGKITVKRVNCMRMCGKGPNIKWDGKLYNRADEALLRELVEGGNQ